VGLYYEIVSKYTKIELTNSIENNANRLTNINKNLGLLLWAAVLTRPGPINH